MPESPHSQSGDSRQRRLTPTELAREVGRERREVVRLCVELGVPIFDGRIDPERFVAALKASEKR